MSDEELETDDVFTERAGRQVEDVLTLNFNYFEKEGITPDVVMSAGLSIAATAANVMGMEQMVFMKLCRGMFDAAKAKQDKQKQAFIAEHLKGGEVH
jgi:hypothetical protein